MKTGKTTLPGEEWRDLYGYEDTYEISSFGRIWRKPGTPKCRYGRELTTTPNVNNGILEVKLSRDGKGKTHHVHRLVYASFVGLAGVEWLLPKDGNWGNVRLDNLLPTTHSEYLEGVAPFGEGKLSPEDKSAILQAKGGDAYAIAKQYGISWSWVYQIWREDSGESK